MLFSYRAKKIDGSEVSGEKEVSNEQELVRLLQKEGLFLISAKTLTRKENKNGNGGQLNFLKEIINWVQKFVGVPLVEKMFFARYLALLVSAGVSLSDGLRILAEQSSNNFFKNILLDLQNNIQKGGTLSAGLEKYPNVFSELFINMVRMGESSGNLESILKSLAEQLKKENDLKSKIRGAMAYPIVIILAMFGVGIFVMIKVVPTLTSMFKELNMELPISTKIVISISDNLTANIFYILLAIVLFLFLGIYISKSKSTRHLFDTFILIIPLIGGVARKINLARFSRTLATLLKSGLPIIDSLQITANTLTNKNYSKIIIKAVEAVMKGEKFSEVLKEDTRVFPLIISQMVRVGEETGQLDEVLAKMAEFYEEEVDVISKSLSTIIEPILMIIIGIVVGFFAVSMIQPIYGLMTGF